MSILKVQELQHTNGTNALTIDTAGTVSVPGHVVNVTTASYNTGASYSANTSYVNTATLGTVTTKLANSKIMIVTDVPIQTQKQNTIWSVALRSSIDSYASNLVIKHFVRYSTNDHTSGFTGMTYLHDANQSAGTAITYRYYVKASNSSGGGWYCIDQWGVSNTSSDYAFTTNMIEIAT